MCDCRLYCVCKKSILENNVFINGWIEMLYNNMIVW